MKNNNPTLTTDEAVEIMKSGKPCKTQYNHEIEYLPGKDAFYITGGITFMPRLLSEQELNQWELRKKYI